MIKKLIFYSNTHYYALGIILKKNLQNSTVINKKKTHCSKFSNKPFYNIFQIITRGQECTQKTKLCCIITRMPKMQCSEWTMHYPISNKLQTKQKQHQTLTKHEKLVIHKTQTSQTGDNKFSQRQT